MWGGGGGGGGGTSIERREVGLQQLRSHLPQQRVHALQRARRDRRLGAGQAAAHRRQEAGGLIRGEAPRTPAGRPLQCSRCKATAARGVKQLRYSMQ